MKLLRTLLTVLHRWHCSHRWSHWHWWYHWHCGTTDDGGNAVTVGNAVTSSAYSWQCSTAVTTEDAGNTVTATDQLARKHCCHYWRCWQCFHSYRSADAIALLSLLKVLAILSQLEIRWHSSTAVASEGAGNAFTAMISWHCSTAVTAESAMGKSGSFSVPAIKLKLELYDRAPPIVGQPYTKSFPVAGCKPKPVENDQFSRASSAN